jgi:lysophospholipase L1-like esterase
VGAGVLPSHHGDVIASFDDLGAMLGLDLSGLSTPKGASQKQTIIDFGDSIAAQGIYTASGTPSLSPQGYFTWAQARLGHRFTLVKNAGVSSDTSTAMLARMNADVLAYDSGYVIVQMTANDLGTMTSAASIANWQTIFDAIRANGSTLVICTLIPGVAVNAAQAKAAAINDFARRYASANSGTVLCDWGIAVANPNGDGTAATGMMQVDGIHPDILGAMRLGKVLADALEEVSAPLPMLPGFLGGATGLLPTPLMAGITSTSQYTGAAPTVVNSQVARTDGLQGVWQQFAVSACPGGWRVKQDNTNLGTDWNVGDTVFGVVEFQVDSGVAAVEASGRVFATAKLEIMDVSATTLVSSASPRDGVGVATTEILPGTNVFRTSNIVIPATATRLRLGYQSGFTGTQRVGRMQIWKAPAGTPTGPLG